MVSFVPDPQSLLMLLGGVALEWVFPPIGTLLGMFMIAQAALHMIVP
jgi:hypothetical protein